MYRKKYKVKELKNLQDLKKAIWLKEFSKLELDQLEYKPEKNQKSIELVKKNIADLKNDIEVFLHYSYNYNLNLPPFYMIDETVNIGYLEDNELDQIGFIMVVFDMITLLFITDNEPIEGSEETILTQVAREWGKKYNGQEVEEDLETIFDTHVLYHGGNLRLIKLED